MTATPVRGESPPMRDERASQPLIATGLVAAVVVVLFLVERADPVPRGTVLRGPAAWTVSGLVVLAGVGLLVHGLVRRTAWHYPEQAERDLRIDLLRGVAIVFVVLNHVQLPSLFQLASQETIGIVSGAELFVAMSGVVVGMVYRERLAQSDLVEVTATLLRRSWKLYCTALVVVLTVYVLTLLPGVDGRAVTTVDAGAGEVVSTYPNLERLSDYPVPGFVIRDLLRLQLGPWQFNVMGLYVVLMLAAPLLLAALRRRLVLLVLASSWGMYAVSSVVGARVLPSQFEDPFPLLIWQVLFVTGLSVGWYRTTLLAFVRRPTGRALLVLVVLAHLGAVLLAASSSFLANGYDVRLDLVPAAVFDRAYADWFDRRTLGLGRLLEVWLVLAALYGFLTAYWRPVSRAVGWFLVPLGQASLYVFILHVFAALIVSNVPGLDGGSIAAGTLAHAVVLAALWMMVTRRVLFRIVPR